MEDLKPCPFCGGEAEILDGEVFCPTCYAQLCCAMSEQEQVKTWNARATDNQLTTITKQRDELAGSIESIREYASMIPLHLTDEDNHSNRHIKHFVEQIIALSTIKEQKDDIE